MSAILKIKNGFEPGQDANNGWLRGVANHEPLTADKLCLITTGCVDRGWIVQPMAVKYWWLIPLAALPGLLGTILVSLDQQITSVIINRKEHKLKVCMQFNFNVHALFLFMIHSITF